MYGNCITYLLPDCTIIEGIVHDCTIVTLVVRCHTCSHVYVLSVTHVLTLLNVIIIEVRCMLTLLMLMVLSYIVVKSYTYTFDIDGTF